MAEPSDIAPVHRTGSLDETLASFGAGIEFGDELPLERGDIVGRYVVLEEIGRGAMGMVVGAYDPELDRRIALKLMPVAASPGPGPGPGHGPGPGGAKAGASLRLLREAQAMARLAHPNVITVHDVGTAGDDVFIAMEYVEGGSLRTWLLAQPRPWHAIVAIFLDAGEGLAAAHREGLVHRDFKPDNVLVRSDGRACVGDFGLARRERADPAPRPLEDMRSTLRDSTELEIGGLTLTGATMGTPAYMAPEQHLRTRVDARSDQFAFCVALWEGLVGERPFAGTTLAAIALNVTTGRREPFPRDSPVPPRIRAALERGLEGDPERRFEDMDALLAELRLALRRATRRRSRRPWLSIVLGLGLIAAVVAYIVKPSTFIEIETPEAGPSACSGAARQLDGVWDDALRDQAAAAFASSERSYAERSFGRARDSLDAARDAWIGSHTRACEATRVYGEQSEELLDRRMICLAQRRSELAAVSAALVRAEAKTIDDVDGLLATLVPIEACDDLAGLEALAPAPPSKRAEIEAARARLAQLSVLRRTAASKDLVDELAKLVDQAETFGYDPILAEALHLHARLLEGEAGPAAALPVARRAVTVATRSGHRRELASALTLVAWLEGTGRANFELGLWLLELAEAESVALGEPASLAIRIASDRASILTIKGDYEAGLREFEAALALANERLGPNHLRAADLRFNIAATRHFLGQFSAAEAGFRAALEVYTQLMGPTHPEVAQIHNNLAATLAAQGKGEEAERHAALAIETWEHSGGHSYLPGAYANLAAAAKVQGQPERALDLSRKAYAMKVEVFGEGHPTTIDSLAAQAHAELDLDLFDEAEAHFEAALAALRALDEAHPNILELRFSLASVATRRGDAREALARLAALDQDLDPSSDDSDAGPGDAATREHYRLAIEVERAQVEAARGRDAEARAALDRAAARFVPGVDEPIQELAQALRAKLDGP